MNPASKKYLNERGITDEVIERYGISGDEKKIIIPVQGFNKYRTYPDKHYFYDRGYKAALFGLPQLKSQWCVLAEGELDALCLASHGFPAVSGTGGAGTFFPEWVSELPPLVFICYDSDKVGKDAAQKIHWLIQNSRIVQLPEETKDATEYFKGHTRSDFEKLMKDAIRIPKPLPVVTFRSRKPTKMNGSEMEQAKSVPISDFIKFTQGKAKCIWHNDPTPSLHYYKQDNRVFCFGCNKWGDVVDVVMQLENLSFKQAIERLK